MKTTLIINEGEKIEDWNEIFTQLQKEETVNPKLYIEFC